MSYRPPEVRIVYRERPVRARRSREVPKWLAIIILTPVLIWAALFLIELEKGQ